jgi:hypothetical protein
MQGGKRQGLLRLRNRDGRRRMSIYQSQTYLNDLRETIASSSVLDELAIFRFHYREPAHLFSVAMFYLL